MRAHADLPPPPRPDSSGSRRSRLLRILGGGAIAVVTIAYYAGTLELMGWGDSKIFGGLEQAQLCERAERFLVRTDTTSIDDTPDVIPRQLVPEELAKSFPGSVPLQARVLTSADLVRETIPQAAAWHRKLEEQGFVIGWELPLSFGALKLVVKMEQFGSHRQAIAYATWLALEVNCRYSNEVFTGKVPGSIGFQIRYRSGDIGEQLTFVRGAFRYTVSVLGPDAPADHTLVDRLALEVARIDQR